MPRLQQSLHGTNDQHVVCNTCNAHTPPFASNVSLHSSNDALDPSLQAVVTTDHLLPKSIEISMFFVN
jgi:hypothetical protein